MRLLFTIPHFFKHSTTPGAHGSDRDQIAARSTAVRNCIRCLHTVFGSNQTLAHLDRPGAIPANEQITHHVDVIVCTSGQSHLLAELSLSRGLFNQVACHCDPRMLGFECQSVMRDGLGKYDFYCYLEDDLLLCDPLFFAKLQWFTASTDATYLLQPNRFEQTAGPPPRKVYVDGTLSEKFTKDHARSATYLNPADRPQLFLPALGVPLVFRRAQNPHAGCFFLNTAQMEQFASQPHFLDRDCSFVGPLESAATLGILRTFRIYKPAPRTASFLEIEHFGEYFIRRFAQRDNTGG